VASEFSNAFAHIGSYTKGLLSYTASMRWPDSSHLQVILDDISAVVMFDRSELDDLETALTSTALARPYVNGVKNHIAFKICFSLFHAGMIPHINMSQSILDDERDWHKGNIVAPILIDPKIAKGLYRELKALEAYLVQSVRFGGVEVPEIKTELEQVQTLTQYYEKNNVLNSPDVQKELLSLLKGAAVLSIMDWEAKKAADHSPRKMKAYDSEICSLIHQFQISEPFDRIQLPPGLREYLAQRDTPAPPPMIPREQLFDLDALLTNLDPRFAQRRAGAWETLSSKNSDHVSQAANSMVELLDKVIDHICGDKPFKDFLKEKYPEHVELNTAMRSWVSAVKDSLHRVKHQTKEQPEPLAEDLMHAAELIIRTLLR
jgi:hypothetical protein